MTSPARKRELGRGERVIPGVWRLRLPLPWPGVPHCNAWAVAHGERIVLIDCGISMPGSLEDLTRALDQLGLDFGQIELLVCTHAHSDHCGQAAAVLERAGGDAQLWIHPDHRAYDRDATDPEGQLARRYEIGLSSGVPRRDMEGWVAAARQAPPLGEPLPPVERDLVDGVVVDSDLGPLQAIETPGHAPGHVCLYQPDYRVLFSGDHLLGRIALHFDYPGTPDPIGDFLASLDRVEALDARLALSGHGRPFTDIGGHIEGNRALVGHRLDALRAGLRDGPRSAFELLEPVLGEDPRPTALKLGGELLAYLAHLEARGEIERVPDGDADRWQLVG